MVKAIRIHKTGGPEVLTWEDVDVPAPKQGEALVRHTAIGLNYIDTYQRSGLYPLPLPTSLGGEGAGVVEAIGPGVTEVAVGDRVAYGTAPPGASGPTPGNARGPRTGWSRSPRASATSRPRR